MTIQEAFKRFRNEHHITQSELATTLGLTQTSYNYEKTSRKANPSAEVLTKIADTYNVSVDYLLGRTDNPAPNTAPLADSAGATPPAKITSDVTPMTNERLAKLEERIERYDSWFKRKGIEI